MQGKYLCCPESQQEWEIVASRRKTF
jgi:hypothetical protein